MIPRLTHKLEHTVPHERDPASRDCPVDDAKVPVELDDEGDRGVAEHLFPMFRDPEPQQHEEDAGPVH